MSDFVVGMRALADARTPLTAFAEALARWLHRDQTDKQGQPYVGHLERVAATVARDGGSEDEVAAAWLHDCVEDGRATERTINELFGAPVAWMVASLTRRTWAGTVVGPESYEDYIERLAKRKIAARVKIADLRDNLDASRGPIPESLRKRYEKALARLSA